MGSEQLQYGLVIVGRRPLLKNKPTLKLSSSLGVPGVFAPTGSLKCYEALANYEGLLEHYRATGDRRYCDAVSIYINIVLDQERMIHGSMSNTEDWFYGTRNQTDGLEQPVGTCVTAQWMLICWQL